MSHVAVVTGCVAWARAVLPELLGGYDYVTDQKTQALPDVMGELQDSRVTLSDPDFAGISIQQAAVRVYRVTLSFMVENSDPPAAATQLRDFADRLGVSLMTDGTLSGRVFAASPLATFDFARPFVEYEDGTRGREMTMNLAVAELVEVV